MSLRNHFRESIEISKLHPDIPAEQARTTFMLARALRKGARLREPDELTKCQEMVTTLMNKYHLAIGQSGSTSYLAVYDFHTCITAKYQ